MAVSILNDLLNYDKLEDGTLTIEPKTMPALPFMVSATSLLLLQAEEKGVSLIFDTVEPEPVIALENSLEAVDDTTDNSPQFLTNEDFFCVDQHKMGQVVRNLISNAIKFTPGGKSVIIKIRKSSPLTHTSEHSESPRVLQHSNYDILPGPGGGRLRAYSTSPATPIVRSRTTSSGSKGPFEGDCPQVDLENGPFLLFASNLSAESDLDKQKAEMADHGYLVLEVIDAGVGMQPEDSKRIFKEVGKGSCQAMEFY